MRNASVLHRTSSSCSTVLDITRQTRQVRKCAAGHTYVTYTPPIGAPTTHALHVQNTKYLTGS